LVAAISAFRAQGVLQTLSKKDLISPSPVELETTDVSQGPDISFLSFSIR